jgi:hypothetical protein
MAFSVAALFYVRIVDRLHGGLCVGQIQLPSRGVEKTEIRTEIFFESLASVQLREHLMLH